MSINLPPGLSILLETNETGTPVIVIPAPQISRVQRYLCLSFLLLFSAFLIGWPVVFARPTGLVRPDEPFTMLALVVSGFVLLVAALPLYRTLRPPVPESLQLLSSGVEFDGGVWPYEPAFTMMRQRISWFGRSGMFPTRIRCTISIEELQSLRLREFMHGNNLAVDIEGSRIEIGQGSTDVGREWLARTLANRYRLEPERVGFTAGGISNRSLSLGADSV